MCDAIKQIDIDIEKKIEKNGYEKSIYHYTSVGAFFNIIQTKQLWLGNTANMNDKREIKYFLENMEQVLIEDLPSENVVKCKEFFERVYERLRDEYPYAISFSKRKDDASQWERYADGGSGVCVCFNTKNVMKLLYDCYMPFQQVFYRGNSREHKHYEILQKYFATGELNEFTNERGLIDNLLACGCIHKHPSFETESEIRAITLWNKCIRETHVESKFNGNAIRRVLVVNMEKRCESVQLDFEDLFDEIIIGPKSKQSVYEMEKFLEEKGLKKLSKKISESECPLR